MGLSVKQQDSILDSNARINLWHGSIRSGKTVASVARWLEYVQTAPPGPLAILGKTKDTIARNVQQVVADLDPGAIAYTRGANTCKIVGRTVEVIGANDARAESKIRGLTLAGAYVDEATLVPEDFWKQTLGRMSVPGAKLFATTNPDNPSHWLKKNYLDRIDELNMRAFHFRLPDNPSLDPTYVHDLMIEYTGLWYKRFIDGLWVAAEGAIYQMLDETIHGRAAPPKERWRAAWIGVDFGTSNSTHAVLIVLAAGDDGIDRLWCVSEWEHDGRAKGQLSVAVQSKRMGDWAAPLLADTGLVPITVLDPSAAPLRVQMRADGWPGLRGADNRVDVGIQVCASLFAADRLVIDQHQCPVLWDQSCGYVWSDKALNRGVEEPVKENDHGVDGKRYGVMAARRVWRQWLPELAASTDREAA